MPGNFVVRQALTAIVDQGFRTDIHRRFQHHAGGDQLSTIEDKTMESLD